MYWLFNLPEESNNDIAIDVFSGEQFAGLVNRKRNKSIKLESGRIAKNTTRNTNPHKEQ